MARKKTPLFNVNLTYSTAADLQAVLTSYLHLIRTEELSSAHFDTIESFYLYLTDYVESNS